MIVSMYGFLADLVVLLHFAFVLFVVAGGLLTLRWRKIAWIHIPAVVWGIAIELTGWVCPLTPLENHFRREGGAAAYNESFVVHYIEPVLYPEGLTRGSQIALAATILIVNVAIYTYLWKGQKGVKQM